MGVSSVAMEYSSIIFSLERDWKKKKKKVFNFPPNSSADQRSGKGVFYSARRI